ncbi:hypothetical protein ACEQ8H_002446 [Pleosporales sp. CAS-2024a]
MSAAGKTLFNNPIFSDIKIIHHHKGATKEYVAHRAILCARSEWFLKALTGSFMEATEGVINIRDDDPVHFEIMLQFIYTNKYKAPVGGSDLEKMFLVPIGVHSLADKYDVEGLQDAVAPGRPHSLEPSNPRTPSFHRLSIDEILYQNRGIYGIDYEASDALYEQYQDEADEVYLSTFEKLLFKREDSGFSV